MRPKSIALLLVSCAIALVACGSESSSTSTPESTPSGESESKPTPCECPGTETCVRLINGNGRTVGNKCVTAPSACVSGSGKCSDDCKRFFCDDIPIGGDAGAITPWIACYHGSAKQ